MGLRISAVMLTNDRAPQNNYVADSLKSLQDSGFFENPHFSFTLINTTPEKTKYIDFLETFSSSIQIIQTKSRLHYNNAMAFGIEYAAQIDCDIVLFMEDDIIVCNDFPQRVIDFISCHGNEQVMLDFVTFYQEIVIHYTEGSFYWDMDANKFYGNQCLALRKDAALSYASYIRKESASKLGFADVWYSDWLAEAYDIKEIRCAVPSLAQHIGKQSNHGHDYFFAPGFADDLERDHSEDCLPIKLADLHLSITKNGAALLDDTLQQTRVEINHSALMVYNLCDGKRKTKEIIQTLIYKFPDHAHDIKNHVPVTINKLRKAGILHILSPRIYQSIQEAVSEEIEFWRLRGGWDEAQLLKDAEENHWVIASFDNGLVTTCWHGKEISRFTSLQTYLRSIALAAPDITGVFAISLNDRVTGNQDFPLLGFSSLVSDDKAVLIPDIHFIEGYRLLRRSIEENSACINWEDKHNSLIWRGSPTGQANNKHNWQENFRVRLCMYSLDKPDVLNAKLSSNVQTTASTFRLMQAAGLVGDFVSIKEQLRYKYIANVDGNSASWDGTFWQLLSNSLMIHIDDNIPVDTHQKAHQATAYRQWYQHWWKPGQHYLRCSLDELEDTIRWAIKHDDQCREISNHATAFAKEFLTDEAGRVYFTELLRALSRINHNQVV